MKAVFALISRNRKLFFKDRGMFFSALITPGILILLYATFLANVYRDSFVSAIPDMITISDKLVDGTVAAQLAAALLAVSCVTVTFCVNLTMVQDRANGTRKDFNVSPISKAQLYLGYFLSTVVNSLLVNGLALVLCLGYMYKMGWYMSAVDVFWVLLDEILLVLFGSTLSSIVSFSTDNPGSVIRSGNDRKCRVWIFMRSLHADFKFRQRPAESTVVSAKYLRNFSVEKSYAPWNLRRDGEQSAARRNDYCDS